MSKQKRDRYSGAKLHIPQKSEKEIKARALRMKEQEARMTEREVKLDELMKKLDK